MSARSHVRAVSVAGAPAECERERKLRSAHKSSETHARQRACDTMSILVCVGGSLSFGRARPRTVSVRSVVTYAMHKHICIHECYVWMYTLHVCPFRTCAYLCKCSCALVSRIRCIATEQRDSSATLQIQTNTHRDTATGCAAGKRRLQVVSPRSRTFVLVWSHHHAMRAHVTALPVSLRVPSTDRPLRVQVTFLNELANRFVFRIKC